MKRRVELSLAPQKQLDLIELAQLKRTQISDIEKPFDPLRYVEQHLPKMIKEFDYDYSDDHPVFMRAPEVLAFVNFEYGVRLFVRSKVMEEAYYGGEQERFILAHEIGHVWLHRRRAKQLARHVIGAQDQYKEKLLELEANLFGGVLLVPPDGIWPGITAREIRSIYGCSLPVADRAIIEAKFWWRAGGRTWQ